MKFKNYIYGIFWLIKSSNVWVQWNIVDEKSIDLKRLGVSRLFYKT